MAYSAAPSEPLSVVQRWPSLLDSPGAPGFRRAARRPSRRLAVRLGGDGFSGDPEFREDLANAFEEAWPGFLSPFLRRLLVPPRQGGPAAVDQAAVGIADDRAEEVAVHAAKLRVGSLRGRRRFAGQAVVDLETVRVIPLQLGELAGEDHVRPGLVRVDEAVAQPRTVDERPFEDGEIRHHARSR